MDSTPGACPAFLFVLQDAMPFDFDGPDFDTLIDRRGTWSMRWDRYPGDVIPPWVADSDFGAPPAVLAAISRRVALSPGAQFGAPGFVRLNFATQRARLSEALERMKKGTKRKN